MKLLANQKYLYNAGWQDAIDYVSQLLGVDIDTADF